MQDQKNDYIIFEVFRDSNEIILKVSGPDSGNIKYKLETSEDNFQKLGSLILTNDSSFDATF